MHEALIHESAKITHQIPRADWEGWEHLQHQACQICPQSLPARGSWAAEGPMYPLPVYDPRTQSGAVRLIE